MQSKWEGLIRCQGPSGSECQVDGNNLACRSPVGQENRENIEQLFASMVALLVDTPKSRRPRGKTHTVAEKQAFICRRVSDWNDAAC